MTGTISLKYKADKKAECGHERHAINHTYFFIIGDLLFFFKHKETGPEGNYCLLSLSLSVCMTATVCLLLYLRFLCKCKVLYFGPHTVTKEPSAA